MTFLNDDGGACAPGFPGSSPEVLAIERYFAASDAAARYPFAREIDPALFAGSKWKNVTRAIAHANGLHMQPFNVRIEYTDEAAGLVTTRDEYIPHLRERHGIRIP